MEFKLSQGNNGEIFKDASRLRKSIFVQEQGISDTVDEDGRDPQSTHLVIYDQEQNKAIATGRLSPEGSEKGCLSRIAVSSEYRGHQLGQKVIRSLEAEAAKQGLHYLYLVPHAHLENFYSRLGYTTIPDKADLVGDYPLIYMEKWLSPS